jgi:hypothetical protein
MNLVGKLKDKGAGIAGRFRKRRSEQALKLLDLGFHGDRYLLDLVDSVAKGCACFIETGTNVGTTLAYIAKTYPFLKCLSCEPDKEAFLRAAENTSPYGNVRVYNKRSQEFLTLMEQEYGMLFKERALFWLDAHGYGFDWPLKQEMGFITSHFENAFIFIDDFKVPDLDCFAYHSYKDQICSFDYIRDSIETRDFSLYYPGYTERTSTHHPLTGWGLIAVGKDGKEMCIPAELRDKITKAV